MSEQHVTARVPGKIMLSGEYAVLFGGRALAGSINQFLTVDLVAPGFEDESTKEVHVTISSDLWEKPVSLHSLLVPDDLAADPLVDAVTSSVQRFAVTHRPVKVSVHSDLDVSHGVGSSSALRLGVAAATWFYAKGQGDECAAAAMSQPKALTPNSREWDMVRFAYRLQKRSQKRASGYDFATQFLGGLVEMSPTSRPKAHLLATANPQLDDEEAAIRAWPGNVASLDDGLPGVYEKLSESLLILVGGDGAPTAQQMKDVLTTLDTEEKIQALLGVSESLHDAWLDWFRNKPGSWEHLLAAIGEQRRFFETSRNFPGQFAEAIGALPGMDEVWSYKTTGAGGEDAIIVMAPPILHSDILTAVSKAGWRRAAFRIGPEPTTVSLSQRTLH